MSESSTPLNNDILLSILSVSPPKIATSIMATCSFLYHEGAKIILQDPVQLFGSEEEALALLRFVQAEDLSRCSYVRRLHIVTLPESVAQILADLVPRMTGLKQLSLARAEEMLESYPYLLPTFAALRSLTTLVIVAYVGERCSEMIRTLQSELVSASIHFPPSDSLDLSLAAASHPILMLQRSASTLEQLSCACLFDTTPETIFSPLKVIYPKLRTLILRERFPPNPLPLIKAFPNLVHIVVESTLAREGGAMHQLQREVMLGLQRPSKDGQPFGWKHLQSFTGHVVDLWVLGLACRIPRLCLEDAPSEHPPLALTDVLTYARPTLLTITFDNHTFIDILAGFLDALRSDGASGLRSLAFVIDLMAGDRDLDVGHALINLESALVGLQLSSLAFSVRDVALAPENASSPAEGTNAHFTHGTQPAETTQRAGYDSGQSAPPLSLAERTLNDFDVQAFVHRLLTAIPTIQNAMVVIERPGRCGGSLRAGYSCKRESRAVAPMYTGGDIVYREASGLNVERGVAFAAIVKSWNPHMAVEM
ncbi:hypothetical protein LXA43DRAFT_629381 [Ganoderma leucocontextum]|nr:hypothetical protein LXA43DRAFT_629381 [Ganoderma leucocontextum]